MIGGIQVTSDPRDFLLVPYCRQIDANLLVTERAPMKAPRCSIPLALLYDKYILAIGGLIGRTKPCSLVQLYDTIKDVWIDCKELSTPRSNCSAVVQD